MSSRCERSDPKEPSVGPCSRPVAGRKAWREPVVTTESADTTPADGITVLSEKVTPDVGTAVA